MNELLNRLARTWPGGLGGRGRDGAAGRGDPGGLAREVVRLHEAGRLVEAREAAERLVGVQRARLGEGHPGYASALTNLALVLQAGGDLDAAEPLFRRAADVRREALGGGDPVYAGSLIHLAGLLQLRGDLSAAEPLMRAALAIQKAALGAHHPDYATGLTGLALLLHRGGKLGAAEPLLREALEVRRAALGDRHPVVASALENLGLVLQGRGDLGAAEPLLREALEVRRAALGEGHPEYTAGLGRLEALASGRVRREAGTIVAAAVPAPAGVGRGWREVEAEVAALAERFARVGAALAEAARGMTQDGRPLPAPLLDEAAACGDAFAAVRAEVVGRAEGLDVVMPGGSVLSLPELADWIARVGRVEEERPQRAAARRRALEVLDRVLSLGHRDADGMPLLGPCHEAAAALRPLAAAAPLSEDLPRDVSRLVDGSHPLAALVRLAGLGLGLGSDEPPGDDEWCRLHGEVTAAFGRSVAAAAVRGRLVARSNGHTEPMPARVLGAAHR